MKTLDIHNWNRKEHYKHFMTLADPYFAVTVPFDVTKAYQVAKNNEISFFIKYLHDCMKAINEVDNLKYRIVDGNVIEHDVIHASATILRDDYTYGFSFIHFDEDLSAFNQSYEAEKRRIQTTTNLFPPINSTGCIHCSAMPWLHFISHKEPDSGNVDSIPKLSFSKIEKKEDKLTMNVGINVNHALVDGYHVSLFAEAFQNNLNTN